MSKYILKSGKYHTKDAEGLDKCYVAGDEIELNGEQAKSFGDIVESVAAVEAAKAAAAVVNKEAQEAKKPKATESKKSDKTGG